MFAALNLVAETFHNTVENAGETCHYNILIFLGPLSICDMRNSIPSVANNTEYSTLSISCDIS